VVLISTPLLADSLGALEGHRLVAGEPGSDAEAEALICPPAMSVTGAQLSQMPSLRVIAVAGTGTDAIDLETAAATGDRGVDGR